MEKELQKFISENNLSPFNRTKTPVKKPGRSIFITKDAKTVNQKALNVISKNFHFADTSALLDSFAHPSSSEEIYKRQEFFKSIPVLESAFLASLKKPKPFWNPDYGIIVVTEDDATFTRLNEIGCSVKFLLSDSDVLELERYDVVQVIDCDNFSPALERLPQTVFLKSIDDAYLERYVRTLSGWKENLEIIKSQNLPEETKKLVDELSSLLYLCESTRKNSLTREAIEESLEVIKEEVAIKVKELSISGDSLFQFLNKGSLPPELDNIVKESIRKTGVPENLFIKSLPISLDEKEVDLFLRGQELNKFTNAAEEVKRNSKALSLVPGKLKELESQLLLFDFKATISNWMKGKVFPEISESLYIENSLNEFLDKPKPISFHLNENHRCSILTGANSGGKTTLLENVVQIVSFAYLGLPMSGKVKVPLFSEIYYFAKNKGSASKGAFETLLTQMSEISPGNKTLILADEIEAVTEPGVAGKMISATAQYFINSGCFLIVATHLGQEIEKMLPTFARIDGIEAKGLDENNELIVEHNPVLGRLASSTPELIVEKMAKSSQKDYFIFLNDFLKNSKK